ncbi:MAG: lytic transglycosylase domain-containing protein [Geminicoccaceae bacterium]
MPLANRLLVNPLKALAVLALFVAGPMTDMASAADLSGTLWETAAEAKDLDPLMLYAVALTESGRQDDTAILRPWPWALNIEGRPVFAESQADAASILEAHKHDSVDVGLLQINIRWHGHRVESVHELLEARTNLDVGAAILQEALATAPNDLTAGVGRYHSARPERARAYARTVLSIYRHLLYQQDAGGTEP